MGRGFRIWRSNKNYKQARSNRLERLVELKRIKIEREAMRKWEGMSKEIEQRCRLEISRIGIG